MRSELYHLILLHVPLNLVWRLIGLNRILNILLLKEQLWKEKCQRKWNDRLYRSITSYRRYFLLRTDHLHGDLHLRGKNESELIRISWYRFLDRPFPVSPMNYILYLTEGRVIVRTVDEKRQLGEEMVLVTGARLMWEYDEFCYFVRAIDGDVHMIHRRDEEGRFVVKSYLEANMNSTYRDMVSLAVLKSKRRVYALILQRSGRLITVDNRKRTNTEEGIVQLMYCSKYCIATLSQKGTIRLFMLDNDITPIELPGNNYIKMGRFPIGERQNQVFIGYKEDGSIEVFSLLALYLNDGSSRPEQLTHELPIRYYGRNLDNDQAIIVTIDGNGYVDLDHKRDLLLDRPQLRYFGVSSLEDPIGIIADSILQ